CGPRTAGSYVQTLVLTDIATGWTECAPLVVREQQLLTTVLSEVRSLLPFALLGFDTDNDSVFMNETGARLLCSGRHRLHALSPLPQERPSLGRTEERRDRPQDGRLPALDRRYGGDRPGEALCGEPAVRELLPAVVQAGGEAARRRLGGQA